MDKNDTSPTLNIIINCAKEEFLQKGFKDASLRNIAKASNVTTGAIYGYFKDKDELFVKLVIEFVDGLYNLIENIKIHDKKILLNKNIDVKSMINLSKESHKKYVEYLYKDIELSKLVLFCSTGSSIENCIDDIMRKTQKDNLKIIKELKKSTDIDEFTIYLLVEFYFKSITQFIKYDIPYEQALKQIEYINTFFFGGWSYLI